MHFRGVALLTALAFAGIVVLRPDASAQVGEAQATFRSGIDLVSVATVVRDRKGRVVRSLTPEDFVVTDGGHRSAIVELRADDGGPASVALLVDGSGSMRLNESIELSRWICDTILSRMLSEGDLASLMSFDTRLLTLREFTNQFDQIRTQLGQLEAYGSTSIYDAIAGAAAAVAARTQQRRAVVVLTDGADNASQYSAEQVARIASTIDVPVYVFAVAEPRDARPDDGPPAPPGALAQLAHATGGDYFPAASPAHAYHAINQLLEELRHQYLIAFEPSAGTGLRRIEIHTRDAGLRVRARTWYTPGS